MDPITTAQAIEIAQHYLDKVVDAPLKEVSGLLADQVNYWRFKNKVNMILKAKEFENKGIDPRKALPGTVVPLIEAAGDADDETLSDMFAGLLASHLNPDTYDTVHPSYAKVLSQLAPLDANILSGLYHSLKADKKDHLKSGFTLQLVAERLGLPKQTVLLSFQNLWRLGICSHGSGLDVLNQAQKIFFTDYGWALMKVCIP